MYFYKLLKIDAYPDSIKYKVTYFNSTFYIVKSGKFFIHEDDGYILNPVDAQAHRIRRRITNTT